MPGFCTASYLFTLFACCFNLRNLSPPQLYTQSANDYLITFCTSNGFEKISTSSHQSNCLEGFCERIRRKKDFSSRDLFFLPPAYSMVPLLAFLVTTTGRQFKLLIYSLVLLALPQYTISNSMVILNEKYYRTLMTEGGDGIRNTFYSHVVLDAFGELTIVEF